MSDMDELITKAYRMVYMVTEFHKVYNLKVGEDSVMSELRYALIEEETSEFCEYLVTTEVGPRVKEGCEHEALKEACDVLYVVAGAVVEAQIIYRSVVMAKLMHALLDIRGFTGLTLDQIMSAFSEVHRSNMSKLDAEGKPIYREDGKVLKGPNYSKADMSWVLGEKV